MAKTLQDRGLGHIELAEARTHPLLALARWRTVLGAFALLGITIFVLGGSWDIQWHDEVGRDRTLIPPHIMMLSGIALTGLIALIAVFGETIWARRDQTIARSGTQFADLFHSSLGAYIIGFSALCAAIAFPLDSYWHSLYGIDVVLWAPFHLMFIIGVSMEALGVAFMLVSAAQLAEQQAAPLIRRLAYGGVLIAFALMLSLLAILLIDAYTKRQIYPLGPFNWSLYSLLGASIGMWILVSAARVLPWRWSVTSVMLVCLLIAGIVELFVPPAINSLIVWEHLSFRKTPHPFAEVSAEWLLMPLLAAVIIDLCSHKNWSAKRYYLTVALSSVPGWLPIPLLFIGLFSLVLPRMGIGGFILTALLGIPGSLLGTWLGMRMGDALKQLKGA